jgi:hypothetical protein
MARSLLGVVAVNALLGTVTFLAGSAIFFGWLNGLKGLLVSPLLSIFGWYFWFAAYGLVSATWMWYRPNRSGFSYRIAVLVVSSGAGYLFSLTVLFLLAAKDQSFAEAFRFAATGAGAISACLVMMFKQRREEVYEAQG